MESNLEKIHPFVEKNQGYLLPSFHSIKHIFHHHQAIQWPIYKFSMPRSINHTSSSPSRAQISFPIFIHKNPLFYQYSYKTTTSSFTALLTTRVHLPLLIIALTEN